MSAKADDEKTWLECDQCGVQGPRVRGDFNLRDAMEVARDAGWGLGRYHISTGREQDAPEDLCLKCLEKETT